MTPAIPLKWQVGLIVGSLAAPYGLWASGATGPLLDPRSFLIFVAVFLGSVVVGAAGFGSAAVAGALMLFWFVPDIRGANSQFGEFHHTDNKYWSPLEEPPMARLLSAHHWRPDWNTIGCITPSTIEPRYFSLGFRSLSCLLESVFADAAAAKATEKRAACRRRNWLYRRHLGRGHCFPRSVAGNLVYPHPGY